MEKTSIAEQQSPSKPKAAKDKKNKTPRRARKKETGTESSKKALSQNPSTRGTSRGVAKRRVAKAVREVAAAMTISTIKLAQSTGTVCLEAKILSGSPGRPASEALVKLTQQQFMCGSKPESSGTRNSPPNNIITPDTDYPIEVDG